MLAFQVLENLENFMFLIIHSHTRLVAPKHLLLFCSRVFFLPIVSCMTNIKNRRRRSLPVQRQIRWHDTFYIYGFSNSYVFLRRRSPESRSESFVGRVSVCRCGVAVPCGVFNVCFGFLLASSNARSRRHTHTHKVMVKSSNCVLLAGPREAYWGWLWWWWWCCHRSRSLRSVYTKVSKAVANYLKVILPFNFCLIFFCVFCVCVMSF